MQRYHNYQPRLKKKARKKREKPKVKKWVIEHLRRMEIRSVEKYLAWCKQHNFRLSLEKSQMECWEELGYLRSLRADQALKRNKKVKNLPLQIMRLSKGDIVLGEDAPVILHLIVKELKQGKDPMAHIQNRFLYHVSRESNLLEEIKFIEAVSSLVKYKRYWIRDFEDWKIKSHNRFKQFNSLINHLFAKYEVPAFVTNAFLRGDQNVHKLFIHIGQGYSVRKFKGLPLPMTKRVAHHFMQASEDCSIREAILWAQSIAMGANPALAQASRASLRDMSAAHLPFWQTVIQFFIDNPDLKAGQFGPVVDYIRFLKYERERLIRPGGRVEIKGPEKPNFSMKGRNPQTLLKLVEKWHQKLARRSGISQLSWSPMGPNEAHYTEGLAQNRNLKVWKIIELLNGKELAAEGRALNHCVASYAQKCMRGKSSIWSMYCNGERVLTIELLSVNKIIVQIRGKRNRAPTPRELRIVRRWAAANELNIAKFA